MKESFAKGLPASLTKIVPVICIIAFLLNLYAIWSNEYLGSTDFHVWIGQAQDLFNAPLPQAHNFYPIGVPLLLKLSYSVFGDYLVAGRILSSISLCLIVSAIYCYSNLLFRRQGDSSLIALSASAVIPFYRPVSSLIVEPSTDFIALSCAMLALSILYVAFEKNGWKGSFFSGVVFGLGYLLRYTNLVAFLSSLAYLIVLFGLRRLCLMRWLKMSGLLVLGFLVGAFAQIVLSMISRGQLFYSAQTLNICLGIERYLSSNATLSLSQMQAPFFDSCNSIFGIIRSNPSGFFGNYVSNLASLFLGYFRMLVIPLVALFGGGEFLFGSLRQVDKRFIALVLFSSGCYAFALSLSFVGPVRLEYPILVPLLSINLSILLKVSLAVLCRDKVKLKNSIETLLILFACGAFAFSVFRPLASGVVSAFRYPGEVVNDKKVLSQGLLDNQCSFNKTIHMGDDFYNFQSPLKEAYSQPWRLMPESFLNSALLRKYVESKNIRCVSLDHFEMEYRLAAYSRATMNDSALKNAGFRIVNNLKFSDFERYRLLIYEK